MANKVIEALSLPQLSDTQFAVLVGVMIGVAIGRWAASIIIPMLDKNEAVPSKRKGSK